MKDCIRVVLAISNFEFGGAQRQLIELVNSSKDLNIDYYLVSLSMTNPLVEDLREGHRFRIIEKKHKYDFSVVTRMARFLKEIEADVVHGVLFDAEIAVRLAGRLAGVKLVLGSERNSEYKSSLIQRAAYRITKALRNGCVANSAAGAKFNARMLGYPSNHYYVVHNGVDTDRFKPRNREWCCKRVGLQSEVKWIGMVGSFKRQKNHVLFLRVCKLLLNDFEDLGFVLVGDTLAGDLQGSADYKLEILADIDSLGLSGKVKLLGNYASIEYFYPVCAVTILPSHYEGTPNVALESMASGVPVVASNVSDNRNVIPSGVGGFVVAVDDILGTYAKVREVLEREQAGDIGKSARQWTIDNFGTTSFARKMRDVYVKSLNQLSS